MTEATLDAPHGDTEPRTRRLGRGLNALLGAGRGEAPDANEANDAGAESNQIHVELIERNPYQPRKDFDAESLQELSDSIRQHGLLQPVLVRPFDGQYQIIAGERRWIAAKKAGLETIPCRVMELEDQSVFEVAIEENLKRKDLNVLEKAAAFQEYIQRFSSTQEELAKKLSLDRSTVANMMRLLDLSEPVKDALRSDRISAGHARAMLALDPPLQEDLCQRVQDEKLTVRKVEQAVRQLTKGEKSTVTAALSPAEKATAPELSPHLDSIRELLQDKFGLKVEIKLTAENAGKISFAFTNQDDFERLIEPLRHAHTG